MTMNSDELNKLALSLFERSLAQASNERESWIKQEAGDNKELCGITLALLGQDEKVQSGLKTGDALFHSLADDDIPEQIGAYKITGLVGRGGMGVVFRGERASGDFEHDVAVKVIRRAALSDKLIQRFENERQTLAKLIHPNIARLYDGGTLGSGEPYIVMEFIDGLPINEWANQEQCSTESRLKLFEATCKAVSYAHQNLIIHRDITPSNVLVDTSGQVKLIDFGIAKPVDDNTVQNDASNSLASMSFTPGFAAPERLENGRANTLSDIFSLGKLLESLFDGLPEDAEINAIIAKGSAIDPSERYNSVDALLDDIENYHLGFPVTASRGGSRYRVAKFYSRHTVGFVFSTVALLALITAFLLTIAQYQRAETARLEADKRFNDVRNLASTMMNDIYGKLYRVPGASEATVELIQAAQVYLDELALEKNAPADLKLEVAVGYTKLGTMVAGAKIGAISDLEAADLNFAKAEEILQVLDVTKPNDSDILTALGKLYYYKAEINIQPRRLYDIALGQLQESEKILMKAVAASPSELAPQLALMYSTCYIGEVYIAQGKTEQAKEVLAKCVLDGGVLSVKFPDNEAILRLRSATGRTLANALSMEEKFAEAIPVLNEAIADLEKVKLLVNAENDSFTLRGLTIAYWRRAYAYSNTENYQEALADYASALAFTNDRLEKDPADKNALWFYYTIMAEKATPLEKLGRYDEAENGLIVALAWYEQRHKEKPQDSSRLGNLLVHHYMMADYYKNTDDVTNECKNYQHAYDYYVVIEETVTPSNWDKQTIKAIEEAATHCNIEFNLEHLAE